jgi:hypothetical protein
MKLNYEHNSTIDHIAIFLIKAAISISILTLLTGLKAHANCTSVSSGFWENGSTWSTGSIPACGDTITINTNHIVTVNTNNFSMNSGPSVFINVFGELHFANGSKLNLSCGSSVSLQSGPPSGRMTAANGGGASNQLNICNETVWQASDGDATGPMTFGTPLPVELLFFNASSQKDHVTLKWATATELNNSHFTVERSSDGYTFFCLDNVKGQGTTNAVSNYSYKDSRPGFGRIYYRLVQVDYDGRSKTSDIVSVKHDPSPELTAFPNPNGGIIKLTGAFDEEIVINAYDQRGRKIASKQCYLKNSAVIEMPKNFYGPVLLRVVNGDGELLMNKQMIVAREY